MRKSLGSTKPTGAVKVKAGSDGRGGIRGLVAAAHHVSDFAGVCAHIALGELVDLVVGKAAVGVGF